MKLRPTVDLVPFPLSGRRRVDEVCDRFEAAWRAGGLRPDPAEFLNQVEEPERRRLLPELVALDLEFRSQAGDSLNLDEYRSRFPEYLDAIESVLSGGSRSNAFFANENQDRAIPAALAEAGYEVEAELGRGGMGVVYRARQVALGREVAVKVIKAAEMASNSELRRFRNEAEAVARLDHPNIVAIHEVGRSRGLDFFSMRLVNGTGLDRLLDDYKADVRASAKLISIAAKAVQHAHERGVLHRDLKPANILVDAIGEPQITDFGLSRRLDIESDATHPGTLVGTPSYMSPEQAWGRPGSVTTLADVYGLGAVLYALLTGGPPHTGESLSAVLDRVRHKEVDPPSKSNPRITRDLEVICLKCLEKDPGRRYANPRALADDIDRWLVGLPIAARPVGRITRATMWCRRHPLSAALTVMLLVSTLLGLIGVALSWREAVRNDREKTLAINYLADNVFGKASADSRLRSNGSEMTVVQMLDEAAAHIGGDFQGQPRSEAMIQETIGWAFVSIGEFNRAENHLRRAVALNNIEFGPRHRATLRATNRLASALVGSGKTAEAQRLLRQNLATAESTLGADDPETLNATERLGDLLCSLSRNSEAEPLLRRTLDARRRVLIPDHPDTLRSIHQLCRLMVAEKRLEEAEPLAVEYERGIRCSPGGPKHPFNVTALSNRGLIRVLQGRPSEALAYYRRAEEEARRILGPNHPTTRAAEAETARLALETKKQNADSRQ